MSKTHVAIAIGLALAVVVLFFALGFFGGGGLETAQPILSGPEAILEELAATGAVASLKLYDIEEGSGAEATPGKRLVVHYTGVLPDGTVFDSSVSRGTPFEFVLGSGMVIQGWERGFQGMKEGGRRLIAVPPDLGYGDRAIGSIPPNSTLIFDVELISVLDAEGAAEISAGEDQ